MIINKSSNATVSTTKRTLTSTAVVLFALAINDAHAIGLGRLNLLSNLGETFKAEIELSAFNPEELNDLKINISSPDFYKKEGLDYVPILNSIKTSLVKNTEKKAKIILTSTQSTNDPVFELLVEVKNGKSTVLKKFTVLLDTPFLQTTTLNHSKPSINLPTNLSNTKPLNPLSSTQNHLDKPKYQTNHTDNTPNENLKQSLLGLKPALKLDTRYLNTINTTASPIFTRSENNAVETSTQFTPSKNYLQPFDTHNTNQATQKKSGNTLIKTPQTLSIPHKKNNQAIINKDSTKPFKAVLTVNNLPKNTPLKDINNKTNQESTTVLVKDNVDNKGKTSKPIQNIENSLKELPKELPLYKDSSKINSLNLDHSNSNTKLSNTVSNEVNSEIKTENLTEKTASPTQIIDNQATIVVPPLPEVSTIKKPQANPINQIKSVEASVKPSSWYDGILGKLALFGGLAALLGVIGLAIRYFIQRRRLNSLDTQSDSDNIINTTFSQEYNHPNTTYSSIYSDEHTLSTLTEFPVSNSENISNHPLNAEPTPPLNFNLNKKQNLDLNTQFNLSDSTTLISNVKESQYKESQANQSPIKSLIKKTTPINQVKTIIVPEQLTEEFSKKQYRLLKNSVDTKPADLTAKVMFIKFLHKQGLSNEALTELDILKTITKQKGPQWNEVNAIYKHYESIHDKANIDENNTATNNVNAFNLDLNNLTVLPNQFPTDKITTPTSPNTIDFNHLNLTNNTAIESKHNTQPSNTNSLTNFEEKPLEFVIEPKNIINNGSINESNNKSNDELSISTVNSDMTQDSDTIQIDIDSAPNTINLKELEEKKFANFKFSPLNFSISPLKNNSDN